MLTETTISKADMDAAVNDNKRCVVCGGQMVIAWGGAYGYDCYILYCVNDKRHTGITRHDTSEEKKRSEYFSMDSTALQKMNETQMVARVGMAKFPKDLTPVEKTLLAQAAITYGFDPIMGEISIFQGRPFISIDGRYRKAQETGLLDGVETRPATKEERALWEIPDGDYFFRADVHVKGMKLPMTGWGRVAKSEMIIRTDYPGDSKKPVVTNPQRMAEKRAEAQALRKAFHIPLPSIEEIGTPEADIQTSTLTPAIEVAISEAPESAVKITNAGELMTALKNNPDTKDLDNDAVYAQLGVKSFLQVKDFAKAYDQLVKLNGK